MVYEKTGPLSENGYFECKLRFITPITDDSIVIIKTSSSKSCSGLDVTNSLENLMYQGIEECTNQFLKKYYSLAFYYTGINNKFYYFDSDSAVVSYDTSIVKQ